MPISSKLLEKLVCPQCGGQLEYDEAKQVLICGKDKLSFKITDDIPVLLIDEADKI